VKTGLSHTAILGEGKLWVWGKISKSKVI